jgi:hypothetical protein
MATATEIIEVLTEETSVPRSAINTIARRLTDDGLMTRGSRGRPAPVMTPRDCVNLILGTLALGDGYEAVSSRIGFMVRKVGALTIATDYTAAPGDTFDGWPKTVRKGPFAATLENLLVLAARKDAASQLSRIIRRIGITYAGRAVSGWVEFTSVVEFRHSLKSRSRGCETRIELSLAGNRIVVSHGNPAKLGREIWIAWETVRRISELGAVDNPNWGARR